MKLSKGFVPLAVMTGLFLSGSAKKTAPQNIKKSVKGLPVAIIKPQPLVDSFKIHAFDCMDDGPVLPRNKGK